MPAQTDNFERHLNNIARGYASMATRLAKGYAPNNHLRASIHSRVEQRGKGNFRIFIQASGSDARAREYGSGIWARRGPKGKILIVPKRAKALVFPWEKANENIPRTADGRVILKHVEHPGVDAARDGEGYLGPAMKDTRKAMRERMKAEGALAIKADLRASFRRK